MTNKNLVVILSHCNTEEKLQVLKDNIDILKKNNLDILLTSHIPLPKNIQSQVEYLVYDKNNPIFYYPKRIMVYFRTLHFSNNINLRLENFYPDYGYTALNQILKASYLGLNLDYTHYSFINYDVIFTPKFIEALKNPSNLLCSKVRDKSINDKFRFPSFMLNILSKENLQKIIPLISEEKYISGPKDKDFKDVEEYWEYLIQLFDYEVFEDVIEDQIRFDNPNAFDFAPNIKEFDFFYQDGFEPDKILLFYNIKKDLKLKINKSEINVSPPVYLFKNKEITQLEYWDGEKFTDITPIFETKRITKVIPLKND